MSKAPFYDSIEEYRMKKREKNSFKTPLIAEVMASGKRFRLFLSFTYHWGKHTKISVPAGFVTDFASIPVRQALILATFLLVLGYFFSFWLFLPGVLLVALAAFMQKLGKQNKAAVIHDYIYQNPMLGRQFEVGYTIWSRKGADLCFLDGMRDLGVAKWKRTLMYWAVRVGGWASWRKR